MQLLWTAIQAAEVHHRLRLAGLEPYIDTDLTGRYLTRAELVFGQGSGGGLSNEPIVSITFNDEGAQLFEEIHS
jgi:hypothetical protein